MLTDFHERGAVMDELERAITRERALEVLRELQKSGDREVAHGLADDALCALLRGLGYADVVAEYEKISKWYA